MIEVIRNNRWLISLFFVALALRLITLGVVGIRTHFEYSLFLGETAVDGYYEIARNVIDHHIFGGYDVRGVPQPESSRAPLYPLFLLPFLYFFNNIWPVIILQVILGSFLPLLGFYLIYRLGWGNWVAGIASVVIAVDPVSVYLCIKLFTETIFTTLFFLFFLVIIPLIRKPVEKTSEYKNFKSIIIAGLLLGMATLTRPTTLYLPYVFVLLWLVLQWRNKKRSIRRLCVYPLVFLSIFWSLTLPWMYRNYHTFGKFSFSSVGERAGFYYLAPSIISFGKGITLTEAQQEFYRAHPDVSTREINTDNASHAWAYVQETITQYPKGFAQVILVSVLTFFTHDGSIDLWQKLGLVPLGGISMTASSVMHMRGGALVYTLLALVTSPILLVGILRVFWVVVTIFFIIDGIGRIIHRRLTPEYVLILVCIGYFTLTTIANGLAVNARFRFPLNIFIIALASEAWFRTALSFKKKNG